MKKKKEIKISIEEYEKLTFMKEFLLKCIRFYPALNHEADEATAIFTYDGYGNRTVTGVRSSRDFNFAVSKLNEILKEEE